MAIGAKRCRLALGYPFKPVNVFRVSIENIFVALGTGRVGNSPNEFCGLNRVGVMAIGTGRRLGVAAFEHQGVHAVLELRDILFVAGHANVLHREREFTLALYDAGCFAMGFCIQVIVAILARGVKVHGGQVIGT